MDKVVSNQIKELRTRINNLENREKEEMLTLLEIMSNITFFGGIKKTNCKYAKNKQCSLFHLQINSKGKIPLTTECRIPSCDSQYNHCHVEISNMTCSFCPHWAKGQSEINTDQEESLRGIQRR